MPNIDKQFMFDSKTQKPLIGSYDGRCYACGGLIPVGAWNWTYNPRGIAGKTQYRHVDCSKGPEYRPYLKVAAPIVAPGIETPKPIEEAPKEEAPIAPTAPIARSKHILDGCDYSRMHIDAPLIVELLKLNMYPFLHGNPGAGKTHLIMQIGEQCKIPTYVISCSKDMLKSQTFGAQSPIPILDPQTNEVGFPIKYGPILQALKSEAAILMFDEVGLAPGSFLNTLNALLAQRKITFDDGEEYRLTDKHFIVFADNSNLCGPSENPSFKERNDAGGAFRNRLFYLEYQRDVELETNVCRLIAGAPWQERKASTIPGWFPANKSAESRVHVWSGAIQNMREQVERLGANGQGVPYQISSRFMFACMKIFIAYSGMDSRAQARLDWHRIVAGTLYEGGSPDKISATKRIVDAFRSAY